jgi:hypothetical protein
MVESTQNFSLTDTEYLMRCHHNPPSHFYNLTDRSYCVCYATTPADPDIAGIGVSATFRNNGRLDS